MSTMRFLSHTLSVTSKDVTASAFDLDIGSCGVEDVLLQRLTTAIGNYVSRNCAEGILAYNETNPNKQDLACRIRFKERYESRIFGPKSSHQTYWPELSRRVYRQARYSCCRETNQSMGCLNRSDHASLLVLCSGE